MECIICSGEHPITEQNPLTAEHIVPEFIGGSDLVVSNVCKKCNSAMGAGFEGKLANSFFYRLARYAENIGGKNKVLPNPFTGTFENDELGKFRITQENKIVTVPEINFTKTTDGINMVLKVDKQDHTLVKLLVVKKLTRYFKNEGQSVPKDRLEKLAEHLLKDANVTNKKTYNPQVQSGFMVDVNLESLLYIKIAYELAVYHLTPEYLNDPEARKLRASLNSQKVHPQLQLVMGGCQELSSLFDDKNHWVMFTGQNCYLNIFGRSAVLTFTSNSEHCKCIDSVIYRFCFKTGKYAVTSLNEHMKANGQIH